MLQRLTSSASCLVAGGDGRDRQLERLLAMQNQGAVTKKTITLDYVTVPDPSTNPKDAYLKPYDSVEVAVTVG